MACSSCYNGCSEITSDKCVKYTGVDVPLLGIENGDSLSYVEQALITFITSVVDGSGVKISLEEDDYCELVSQYLQACSTVTALDLFKALVKAACNLQEQIDDIVEDIETIEADYTVDCLEGVSSGDGTHAIVQAVITKLCEIDEALTLLATDVDTNYVKISDINSYIAAYLADQETANRYYTRMIPYTAVEYYGSLGFFDATGAGIANTEWEKIYLCNGLNGTPDKRGRSPIGAINGVPGPTPDSTVNPSSDPTFNPNYSVLDTAGANKVTLTTPQIPSHDHTATVNEEPHTHTLAVDETVDGPELTDDSYIANVRDSESTNNYILSEASIGQTPNVGKVLEAETGITVSISSTGGGQAHDNKHPVIACYYIMHIP